jgi:hypothetical protein
MKRQREEEEAVTRHTKCIIDEKAARRRDQHCLKWSHSSGEI